MRKLKISLMATEEGGSISVELWDKDKSIEELEEVGYRIMSNLHKRGRTKDSKLEVV